MTILAHASSHCAAESSDAEDLDALTTALEISSAYEQLQESCAMFKSAAPDTEEPQPSSPGQSPLPSC